MEFMVYSYLNLNEKEIEKMKVAYSACFGGFSLSREAILLGREISKNDKWVNPSIKGDSYENGDVLDFDYGSLNDESREDETLIAVIEQLGDKANGNCSNLAIKEIPDGAEYEITEYDGFEDVEPPRKSW